MLGRLINRLGSRLLNVNRLLNRRIRHELLRWWGHGSTVKFTLSRCLVNKCTKAHECSITVETSVQARLPGRYWDSVAGSARARCWKTTSQYGNQTENSLFVRCILMMDKWCGVLVVVRSSCFDSEPNRHLQTDAAQGHHPICKLEFSPTTIVYVLIIIYLGTCRNLSFLAIERKCCDESCMTIAVVGAQLTSHARKAKSSKQRTARIAALKIPSKAILGHI